MTQSYRYFATTCNSVLWKLVAILSEKENSLRLPLAVPTYSMKVEVAEEQSAVAMEAVATVTLVE